MRVLVTRPHFDAARTAAKLATLGHEALLDPLIEIEALSSAGSNEGYSALVFTSANAVRVATRDEALKRLPAFAVGPRTAEVAKEAGFRIEGVAAGDVRSLSDLIAGKLSAGARVLHLAGEDRAGDLPGALSRNRIELDVRVIYRARAAESLQPETIAAFEAKRIDAVLHYSARSAAAFASAVQRASLQELVPAVRHCCISSAAASPLLPLGVKTYVANSPSEDALLALLTG